MKDCRSVPQIMTSIMEEANVWAFTGNKVLHQVLPRRQIIVEQMENRSHIPLITSDVDVVSVSNVN